MTILESVLNTNKVLATLERSKEEQMKKVLSTKYNVIGGVRIPTDPVTVAAAAKQVQISYDNLIIEGRQGIRATLDAAEKAAKKKYFDALPFGSDYQGEIDRLIKNYEKSAVFPQMRDNEFMLAAREHVELGDKWGIIYVMAGVEIFPGNAEMLDLLEKVAPEIANARADIETVNTAKRLAEVFELTYYEAPAATDTIDRIHIKQRLAALGANPNFDIDNEAIYTEFCKSIGVNFVTPEIIELSGSIGASGALTNQTASKKTVNS